ncbi:hypothetical protein D3C81_992390 [compost metagenome]
MLARLQVTLRSMLEATGMEIDEVSPLFSVTPFVPSAEPPPQVSHSTVLRYGLLPPVA